VTDDDAFGAAIVAARRRGDTVIGEPEALLLAARLGLAVPRFTMVGRDVTGLDLDRFPGDRVVVKAALAAAHKTELGAVRVVRRRIADVAAAVAEMARTGADRFMVVEFVPHDAGPAGTALLGIRWTPAFGPIVTVGPGGAFTGVLGASLPPAVLSAADPGSLDPALAASPFVSLLTGGYRGRAPAILPRRLRTLVTAALDLAGTMVPDPIAEFEVNPVAFTASGPVALDAVARLGGPTSGPAPPRPTALLDRLLEPGSIAIVGVSRGMNVGRTILRNVLAAGFDPDRVTVVKEGIDRLDGCRCVPGLASLPGRVDLLVVAVEAEAAAAVVEEAAAGRHAAAVILVSGGAGERPGTEPVARRITDAAAATRPGEDGVVVNGPNSLGIRSAPGRYDTFFIPAHKLSPAAPAPTAPVAFVSQSGAFILSRLDRLAWLRPGYAVSVGNQVDLTVGDYVARFARSPDVSVIACYVEGFPQGEGTRFVHAVRIATTAGKTVVVYPAGRTGAGVTAAASHTASIAGDHAVTTALAAVAGALVAGTIEDFDDQVMLATMLTGRPVAGTGLGVVGNAGFETVAVADHAGPLGLAALGPGTVTRIDGLMAGAGLGAW
jgi:acyl-CoA synthetase (NDP forming)